MEIKTAKVKTENYGIIEVLANIDGAPEVFLNDSSLILAYDELSSKGLSIDIFLISKLGKRYIRFL